MLNVDVELHHYFMLLLHLKMKPAPKFQTITYTIPKIFGFSKMSNSDSEAHELPILTMSDFQL